MQKRILAFQYNEDRKHTAQFISDTISMVAKYYGLEHKILCISFDNASNNTAAVDSLKIALSPPLADIFHVRCACHIYNLIVKYGLYFFEPIIEKVRHAVGFIQGNNRKARLKEFKRKCEENNLRPRLMPEEIETRWNSTYDFLKTCNIYKAPITTTFNQYAYKFPEVMLQESDWDKINDVVIFLEKFYLATVEFSGAYYPTVCNILAYIADLSLLLMEYRCKTEYKDAITQMVEKFKKYFFPIPPIYLIGAMLNPCMKFTTMSEFVRIIYSSLEIKPEEKPSMFKTMSDTNDHIQSLYNHYVDLLDNATPTHTVPLARPSDEPSSSKRQAHGMPAHCVTNLSVWSKIQPTSQRSVNRDELNYYLRQAPESYQNNVSALDWWKNNQNQYPVLSTMARDVLNVPMSTVASESAFSQGRQ